MIVYWPYHYILYSYFLGTKVPQALILWHFEKIRPLNKGCGKTTTLFKNKRYCMYLTKSHLNICNYLDFKKMYSLSALASPGY